MKYTTRNSWPTYVALNARDRNYRVRRTQLQSLQTTPTSDTLCPQNNCRRDKSAGASFSPSSISSLSTHRESKWQAGPPDPTFPGPATGEHGRTPRIPPKSSTQAPQYRRVTEATITP
jgi:hypothetical protein